MTYQTTLPKQQIGSLGTEKIDRTTVVNLYKDTVASEVNLSAKCMEELFERVGLYDGSFSDMSGTLESDRIGYNKFIYYNATSGASGSSCKIWDAGGLTDPTYTGQLAGGIKFSSNADIMMSWPDKSVFNESQNIYIACHIRWNGTISTGPAYPHCWYNDTGTEHFGVALFSTGEIKGYVTTVAGGTVYTDTGATWTAGTEFLFRGLTSGGKWLIKINEDAIVDCGTVTTDNIHPLFKSLNETAAGEYWRLRSILIKADWLVGDTES